MLKQFWPETPNFCTMATFKDFTVLPSSSLFLVPKASAIVNTDGKGDDSKHCRPWTSLAHSLAPNRWSDPLDWARCAPKSMLEIRSLRSMSTQRLLGGMLPLGHQGHYQHMCIPVRGSQLEARRSGALCIEHNTLYHELGIMKQHLNYIFLRFLSSILWPQSEKKTTHLTTVHIQRKILCTPFLYFSQD